MDTMTYVVVAGWVCMYFIPHFGFAFVTAGLLAAVAAFLVYLGQSDGAVVWSEFAALAMSVTPIAFVAIFMAWPLGAGIRWVRGWWERKAAGA